MSTELDSEVGSTGGKREAPPAGLFKLTFFFPVTFMVVPRTVLVILISSPERWLNSLARPMDKDSCSKELVEMAKSSA